MHPLGCMVICIDVIYGVSPVTCRIAVENALTKKKNFFRDAPYTTSVFTK